MSTNSPRQIDLADRKKRTHSKLWGTKWATGCLFVLIICCCQISCLDPKERSNVEVYGVEFRTRYSHGSAIVEGDFIDVERRGYWGWSRVFRAWHADSIAIRETGNRQLEIDVLVHWQWRDPSTAPSYYRDGSFGLGNIDPVGDPEFRLVRRFPCSIDNLSRLPRQFDADMGVVRDSTGEMSGTKGLIGHRVFVPYDPK